MKDFIMMRVRIKRIIQDDAESKPDILLHYEIKLGLAALSDEENDKDLLCKIGICIVYFGMLRRGETLFVEIKEATVSILVSIAFLHKTKRRAKDFRFKLSD